MTLHYLFSNLCDRYENVKKDSGTIAFGELSAGEQAAAVKKRLKGYSLKVYKSSKKTVSEKKVDTVCMREDPFYVDTVTATTTSHDFFPTFLFCFEPCSFHFSDLFSFFFILHLLTSRCGISGTGATSSRS